MSRGHPATPENFWSRIDQSGGPDACWPWLGCHNGQGYGLLTYQGVKNLGAHRMAYEFLVGPIPDGLVIDHLCRFPPCCNPAHMEPVTLAENNLRGVSPWARNARKTSCIHGHPFTKENTWIGNGTGRICRTCTRARKRMYYERRHEGPVPL